MHVFGEEILKIPELTPHGTKQLITDTGESLDLSVLLAEEAPYGRKVVCVCDSSDLLQAAVRGRLWPNSKT